ncbi:MAG: BrnA antitoxin family protein [Candidatus Omnitrophota bacterium]
MNEKRQKEKIVRMSSEEIKQAHRRGDFGETDWKRLDAMTDKELEEAVSNDPDAAPLVDPSFWQDAKVVMPESKMDIHIRLDPDIVAFFKKGGPGYQTRMNAVLRTYVEAHRDEHS